MDDRPWLSDSEKFAQIRAAIDRQPSPPITPNDSTVSRYRMDLRALRGKTWGAWPVHHRLKIALKVLLRRFGFRCEALTPLDRHEDRQSPWRD
jgi:hypothetical protein